MFFSSSQTLHSEKPDTTEPEMLFSLFSLLAEWIVPPHGAPVSGVGTGRVHRTLSEGKVHGGGGVDRGEGETPKWQGNCGPRYPLA